MRCVYESRNKGSLRAYWSSLSDQKDHENRNSGNTKVFICKCRRKWCPTWKLYVGIVRCHRLTPGLVVYCWCRTPPALVTKIVLFPIWLAQSHYMQETRRVTLTKFCVFRTGNGTLLLFRQTHSDEGHFCQGIAFAQCPDPAIGWRHEKPRNLKPPSLVNCWDYPADSLCLAHEASLLQKKHRP